MFPIKNLKPFDRHKYILNNYVLNKSKSKEKRDADIIRENHKFLWDDDDETPNSWEERYAKLNNQLKIKLKKLIKILQIVQKIL